jgi:hypothetical protein
MLVAMVMLFGCATHDNPVMPEQNATSAASLQKLESPAPILQGLPLPLWGRSRTVSVTQHIVASQGGTISISYAYWTLLGKCSRDASLTIPPRALDTDMDITVALDSAVVGVRFAPEGLVFKTPALLNFSSKGLDLTNVLSGTVYSLYYDSETGLYQQESCNRLATNVLNGSIGCANGEIPHFSRYAFGR